MKVNVGKAIVSIAMGTLIYTSALTAQTSTLPGDDDDVSNPGLPTDPSYPSYPGWDHHGNNRAVAFGSVLLKDFGSDYDRWQAIEAYSWCDWPFPIPGDDEDPVPVPGNGSGGGNSGGTTVPDCPNTWDVMVVTDYRLEVCPDGRAYIARSGDGVIVTDRHTGEFYAWSEVYGCESGSSSGSIDQAMNKKRPIDRKLIKRIMK